MEPDHGETRHRHNHFQEYILPCGVKYMHGKLVTCISVFSERLISTMSRTNNDGSRRLVSLAAVGDKEHSLLGTPHVLVLNSYHQT